MWHVLSTEQFVYFEKVLFRDEKMNGIGVTVVNPARRPSKNKGKMAYLTEIVKNIVGVGVHVSAVRLAVGVGLGTRMLRRSCAGAGGGHCIVL